MSSFDFNDFKFDKDDSKKKSLNKKKIIGITTAIAAILVMVLIILLAKGCGTSSSSVSDKEKILNLAKNYMNKGAYDRALDYLDKLLENDPYDIELNTLLDQILELKKNADSDNSNQNLNVSIDTDNLQNSIEDMARQNQAMQQQMANFQKQQEKALENERIRKAEQEKMAKEAEIQRQKEEAERKAIEEAKKQAEAELARKNAQLQKEIASVNDKIAQGRAALDTGNINGAIADFEHAKNLLPISDGEPAFSASKYSQMASLLHEAAQNAASDEDKKRLEDKAVEYATQAVALNPKDADSLEILGLNELEKKNNAKALDYLTKAAQYDGKNYLYYYNLGRVQFIMGKYSEAKASFTKSTELNATFAPSRYNLGMTKNKLNDSNGALSDFRKAHDIDPRHEKAYLEEARILSRKGDQAGAIAAYKNVLNINSVNRQALQELGSSYSKIEKWAEAEESFRKSLALLKAGTEDPLTQYNLSTALFEQKKIDDAVSYAKKAYDSCGMLKDMKRRSDIIYNYALICDKTGRTDEAITLYAEALKNNPSHVKAQINLGVMYMNMDPPDSDNALAMFLKAYAMDKNNFEVNNNLGSAYLEKKDYTNAITYFQNALNISQNNNDVRFNLAQAFASDKQYDNAKTTYTELLRRDSSNCDAYIELGKVCLQLGDNQSAEKYLVTAQAKRPDYRKAEIDSLLNSISNGR
ncbi:MAG: tetratricopeptide repeat protein [Treponema sp.]|nr:tetratricopeptide repeat protein [Treponema sp.]